MSYARNSQDWDAQIKLAIYPKTAEKLRQASLPRENKTCTMCGEFCAISTVKEFLKARERGTEAQRHKKNEP